MRIPMAAVLAALLASAIASHPAAGQEPCVFTVANANGLLFVRCAAAGTAVCVGVLYNDGAGPQLLIARLCP